jgi:two-component system response regulator FixJ
MDPRTSVYVIDDDPGIRDSLRFLFETQDLQVEVFASAREFLAAGGAGKTGCVVVDVRMPDMTGLDLQEELAQSKSALAVILITGHADVPMAVRAMRAGAFDFLEKPIADDALVDSVRRALAPSKERAPEAAPADPARIAAITARLALLTPREREVLDHIVQGGPHKVIAHALKISPRTIEVHRARIMQKLEARNLAHLVEMVLTSGIKAPRNP